MPGEEAKSFVLSGPVRIGCVAAAALLFAGVGGIALLWGLWELSAKGWNASGMWIIGGAGFMIMGALVWLNGWLKYRRQRWGQEVRREHPEEPWLWNPKWMEGRVRFSDRAGMLGGYLWTVVWLGLGIPAAIRGLSVAHGNKVGYVALVFPLVGVVFLIAAVLKMLRLIKFGSSVLELATLPGVIGGQIVGVIYTRHRVAAADGYHLQLRCIRRVVSGSGDDERVSEDVLWEDEATMTRGVMDDEGSQTAIPVGFQIPADCLPSDDSNDRDSVYWQLQARAKIPGLNYLATFVVPVFRAAETAQADRVEAVDPVAAYRAPVLPQAAPTLPGIELRDIPGGIDLRFRAGRNPGPAAMLTLYSLGFAGIGIGLGLFAHVWFFSAMFCLVGLLGLIGAARSWFLARQIVVAEGRVRIESRFLGIPRRREFSTSEIADVLCNVGSSFGQTAFYRIRLKTAAGRTFTAASGIPKRKEVEWLADKIRGALTQDAGIAKRSSLARD